MIMITIGIVSFLIGTLLGIIIKRTDIILVFSMYGYISLIIGSYTHMLNFILLWVCLILNIIGLVKVVITNERT